MTVPSIRDKVTETIMSQEKHVDDLTAQLTGEKQTLDDVLASELPSALEQVQGEPASEPGSVPQETPVVVEGEVPPVEGETPAGEEPQSYFEVDLTAIEDQETRNAILAALQSRDTVVQRLQREAAERAANPPEPAPEGTPPEGPTLPTDAELMLQAGIDPADPYFEMKAETLLPALRRSAALEARLDAREERDEMADIERHWQSEYDRLERENGKTGVDFDTFIGFAIENDIADPEAVFWRLAGPARMHLAEELLKLQAQQTQARKEEAVTLRPGSGAPVEPKVPAVAPTLRQAVLDAAAKAQKSTGYNWDEAVEQSRFAALQSDG